MLHRSNHNKKLPIVPFTSLHLMPYTPRQHWVAKGHRALCARKAIMLLHSAHAEDTAFCKKKKQKQKKQRTYRYQSVARYHTRGRLSMLTSYYWRSVSSDSMRVSTFWYIFTQHHYKLWSRLKFISLRIFTCPDNSAIISTHHIHNST